MDRRKAEKIGALVISLVVVMLSMSGSHDWGSLGLYEGCGMRNRLLYPFFHAGLLHALLNAWCLLSVVFVYDIGMLRLLVSFAVAMSVPCSLLNAILPCCMDSPTVGLSGVVFVLFGSISFEVSRKWYYQSFMTIYLVSGFVIPNMNGMLHLYCYAVGLLVALLNKPIKIRSHD